MVSSKTGAFPKNSPAEAVAVNEDLITAILVCLPAKSVIRFKSVSKLWLSLICTPSFCHRHSLRNPNYVTGIFLKSPDHRLSDLNLRCEFEYVSFDGNHARVPSMDFYNIPNIRLLQSCNGLLLCASLNDEEEFTYYVCNPTTKQFRMLVLPSSILNGVCETLNLAYEPSKSPHYKVVCIWRSNLESEINYQFVIYSSESGSWRLSRDGDPFTAQKSIEKSVSFGSGVFCNGAIHWHVMLWDTFLYFHVERECLKTMPRPMPPSSPSWKYLYFGQYRGHLHIVLRHGEQLRVLEMERDYSGWFVKYIIDLEALGISIPEIVQYYGHHRSYKFVILSIIQEEKEEEWTTILILPFKVVSYNLKDESFKVLYHLLPDRNPGRYYTVYTAYQFIESISSCV